MPCPDCEGDQSPNEDGTFPRSPKCADPRLAALLRHLNDGGSDEDRRVLLGALLLMHDLPVGAQRRLCARVEARILRDVAVRPDPDDWGVVAAIESVAALLDRRGVGDEPTAAEWSAAESAASAARGAGSAAWSAASAARGAASAAWSAAWSAWSAARSAACRIVLEQAQQHPEGA